MRQKKIYRWLELDMLIFIVANAFLIYLFQDQLWTLANIGYFKLIVLGLAAYRAANIISNEPISKPLRAPFVEETHKDGKIIEVPKKSSFLGATGQLIYCPSCTGVWLSAILIYLYVFYPAPTFLISLLLALSAIERIISALVGWLRHSR